MNEKIPLVIAVLALLVAVAAAVLHSPPAALPEKQSILDEIQATGQIKVMYINYPPFSIKDPKTGAVTGVFVDVIERIAEKMKAEPVYIETTWAQLVLDLASDRGHVNVTGIFPLVERAQGGVIFSKPLAFLGNNAIVKVDDDRFQSLEEINQEGLVVVVTEGEQGHEIAKKHLPKVDLRVISSGDLTLAFAEVSAGRADVALGDEWMADRFAQEHPEVRKLFEKPILLRGVTFAVKRGDQEWLNFLNNAIEVMQVSGEMDEIYEGWDVEILKPKVAFEGA